MALVVVGAAGLAAAQVPAGGTAMRFDLPAQPLEISLSVFGRVTGHSVLVASSVTAGREAAAVQGEFTPREALQRMLAGTGLAARYSGADAFTLVPIAQGDEETDASQGAAAEADGAAAASAAARAQAGYAGVLQASVTRVLCIAQPDAFGRYRLGLQLWIDAAGAVSEARVLQGSGVAPRDAVVLANLRAMALDAPPPPGLAQPVTILLTPRADPARDCRPYQRAARALK